jgi:NTE family protein
VTLDTGTRPLSSWPFEGSATVRALPRPDAVVPGGGGVLGAAAPWDFGHSRRLISTASVTAGRFLDGLSVTGPGLYRGHDHRESSAITAEPTTPSRAGAVR